MPGQYKEIVVSRTDNFPSIHLAEGHGWKGKCLASVAIGFNQGTLKES